MPLTNNEITSARLRRQRLIAGHFSQPEDVVSWQGAVQAQEYEDAKWALALRMRRADEPGIERAFADGRILRTHVLRPTWHFVAPADIRWMLALTGPAVSRRMAPYNRRLELDATVFRRSEKTIARALAGGARLTRQELKSALQRAGIETGNVQRLAHIVMQAELDAVVCSGPRRNRKFTYALLDDRVSSAPALSRDDALAELTRRYFRSHGPAQVHDFAWWSGLTIGDARAGLAMLDRELVHETLDGKTYWFPSSRRTAATERTAYLLPLYDEYLIAYRDRSAALDRQLWTWTSGEAFNAPVVVGGQVVGGWRRRVQSKRVAIALTMFTDLPAGDLRLIDEAARRYAAFQGLDLDLSWSRRTRTARRSTASASRSV
jgi:hypothetical protein